MSRHSHADPHTQDLGFPIWKFVLLGGIYSIALLSSSPSLHPDLHLLLFAVLTSSRMAIAVARASARKAANAVAHGGFPRVPGRRHASTASHGLGPCPPRPPRLPANRLFSATRNFFTFVVNQLAAPGLRVPTYSNATASRSLHSAVPPSIQSRLSFHAKTALSSGTRTVLPRPPSAGVRVVTNVGLGAARNFATATPIFQNMVENAPIAIRALYESKVIKKRHTRRSRPKRLRRSVCRHEAINTRRMMPIDSSLQFVPEEEISHYFDEAVAPVTTFLWVPLHRPPYTRVPLPAVDPSDVPRLLPPLSQFSDFHASYASHEARAENLFRRLDQNNVWEKGVQLHAFGQTRGYGDSEACCSLFRVDFKGWTQGEVQRVIGESGTGWCRLEEVRHNDTTSSVADSVEVGTMNTKDMESPMSFVMPTMDISSHADSSPLLSPSLSLFSLPSSEFESQPLSPRQDTVSDIGYDDPWSDFDPDVTSESEDLVVVSSPILPTAHERGWRDLGTLQFSARHLDISRIE